LVSQFLWSAPLSWDSEFLSSPPVHADLRPVQAGGPPIWIGGAGEAAMRRVGRSGVGWLAFEGLPDEVPDHLWSIARRAAQDADRDPDALKTAMRINLEPGTSVDSLAGKLTRFAGAGIDEASVDAFAAFPGLDQTLDALQRSRRTRPHLRPGDQRAHAGEQGPTGTGFQLARHCHAAEKARVRHG
jgi:alkanesulfonate monooxygenase SsuD/methylene tetrahydromethanopterin reductase-like flavin-dependent oxidoreductase (luciferase family)